MRLLLLVGAVSVPKHGAVNAHNAKPEAGVAHAKAPEPTAAASTPRVHENPALGAPHVGAATAPAAKPATARHAPLDQHPAKPVEHPKEVVKPVEHPKEVVKAVAKPVEHPKAVAKPVEHSKEVAKPVAHPEAVAKPVEHPKAPARRAALLEDEDQDAAQLEHLTKEDAAQLQHEKDEALAALSEHIARAELQRYEDAEKKPNASDATASSGAFLSRFQFPVKPRPVFFAGDGNQDGWTSNWALFEEMPLLFVLPGAAVICILALLAALVRYLLTGGLELHWSAQLSSRTDWSKLSDGDFVKVVGHVSAINKAQELVSPLAGAKCVAYSVSIAFDKGGKWVPYTSHARVTSFTVLDDSNSALLISEKESYMYNLSTVKEWTYSTATCPKEFQQLLQKKGDASPSLPPMRLRFREEVLEVGAKVSCVGAVSTQRASLPTESVCLSSVGSLRPAYATLMFRDERIPWAKMTELGTDDWAKLAASVLVSGYRPGR